MGPERLSPGPAHYRVKAAVGPSMGMDGDRKFAPPQWTLHGRDYADLGGSDAPGPIYDFKPAVGGKQPNAAIEDAPTWKRSEHVFVERKAASPLGAAPSLLQLHAPASCALKRANSLSRTVACCAHQYTRVTAGNPRRCGKLNVPHLFSARVDLNNSVNPGVHPPNASKKRARHFYACGIATTNGGCQLRGTLRNQW